MFKSKIVQLETELAALNSLLHIVIISESWLDDSVVLSEDTFANFNFFCTDRITNGAGVLMLVNKLLHILVKFKILVRVLK